MSFDFECGKLRKFKYIQFQRTILIIKLSQLRQFKNVIKSHKTNIVTSNFTNGQSTWVIISSPKVINIKFIPQVLSFCMFL